MNNNLQGIKQRFGIIGGSGQLENALNTAVRVASTDLSVLITGESGVGKEVFSKIIHNLSSRKHNAFIAVNCGAIPEGTINSELFGHEKGAFTGSVGDRKGYFETVNGGTIFLDEIGEMPLDTQAFLLRVLESGEYIKVGSSKIEKTNVRVIAATNVDLEEKIRAGKFREDLYYRLSTVPIKVPSLKERREDISLLFRKFASDFAQRYQTETIRLDERATLLLENYAFPGNIRELKNIAEQLSVLSEKRLLGAEDLLSFLPQLMQRNLPTRYQNGQSERMDERDILYKLLFEMRSDMTDLKRLVSELIQANNLQMPTSFANSELGRELRQVPTIAPAQAMPTVQKETLHSSPILYEPNFVTYQPQNHHDQHEEIEIIEDSLSLAEMEKTFILKALKKHHNRRKEAADDLGISERTLYRKIKEYELE